MAAMHLCTARKRFLGCHLHLIHGCSNETKIISSQWELVTVCLFWRPMLDACHANGELKRDFVFDVVDDN